MPSNPICFSFPGAVNQTLAGFAVVAFHLCILASATAQTPPVNGITPADVRWDAIEHATIFITPEQRVIDSTIVMRDGWIVDVGPSASTVVPPGATRHDATGKTVYAGFIESALFIGSADQARRASQEVGAHWNPLVTPQVSAQNLGQIPPDLRKEMRRLGFTTAVTYPDSGIFRGSGSLTLLGEPEAGNQLIDPDGPQVVGMGRAARDANRNDFSDDAPTAFPNSTMGAITLIRQTLLDGKWRAQSQAVWQQHPQGKDPPAAADALDALRNAIEAKQRVLFDCVTDLDELRAGAFVRDFNLKAALLGSGLEFRHLNEIAALKLPIIVPLEFPSAPDISSRQLARSASLRDLASWAIAPSNASRLLACGVDVSLTTARLPGRSTFPAQVREARAGGLSEAQFIASLTTSPAKLLGKSALMGTVAAGMMANLVVSDGAIYADDSRIIEVWISGRRYECADWADGTPPGSFDLSGRFGFTLPDGATRTIIIDSRKGTLSIEVPQADQPPRTIDATAISLEDLRGRFVIDGSAVAIEGPARCAIRIENNSVSLEATDALGTPRRFVATRVVAPPVVTAVGPAPAATPATTPAPTPSPDLWALRREVPVSFPLGDFGLASVPTPQNVVFRNATVWTSTPQGILNSTDVLVRAGVIEAVGNDLVVPGDVREIDCAGRHLTPGIVDCHSHSGIDGQVNEWSQACTAEVRIEDVVDPDDVAWYRELAGGVTSVNQLHGSANPIGGQNSVVKLKWGSPLDEWRARAARPGIKFALGENVVRPINRYPNTRMGVEAFMRDRFLAARQYRQDQASYEALRAAGTNPMPPRTDFELEALAEILEGKRIVHCHAYRQDEVLMLIRLADEFGFQIATFQHILEGYKVADAIARHGAGASCFSDWWAYKMEVMDAIPWGGAMMLDHGVVVSFNSDSDEVARHLNLEAAKAVKYGGVDPARALEFVTINPARQLGMGSRTGSIEIGKDADIAIWSGDPLSPLSICQQTWVEGTKRFDRDDDIQARPVREALRQRLIAAATITPKPTPIVAPPVPPPPPAGVSATPPAPARLMDRMLEAREDALLDLWRRGRSIGDLKGAGICGCAEVAR